MKKKRIKWLLVAAFLTFISPHLTLAQITEKTQVVEEARISCYSCGHEEINPNLDKDDTYCDADKYNDCAADKKMYNHTCDIMDRMGISDRWIRECPEGVKSCFYSEGKYDGQVAIFRGCADARYPHDEKCSRSLQAVSVVEGKSSVDVEVHLCYCNENTCNQVLNGAISLISSFLTMVLTPILLYVLMV